MRLAELRNKRDDILRLAEKHGARNVRVFGSTARGDDDPSSDIDFLIDYDPNSVSFLFPGGLMSDLEALLQCKVDIITDKALRPPLSDYIVRDAVLL